MFSAEIRNEGSTDYWEDVLWRIFLTVKYACISCKNLPFFLIFFTFVAFFDDYMGFNPCDYHFHFVNVMLSTL